MNDDGFIPLSQILIGFSGVVVAIVLGIFFLSQGFHILGYYSFWMVLFPVGVYMLFAKRVYFLGWDLSTKDRRVGLGLLTIFIFPLLGTCNMAWNGTFRDARIMREMEARVQANPALWLRLPILNSDYREINSLYYRIMFWSDPINTPPPEGVFELRKIELLHKLNTLIDDPDAPEDDLEIARQMLNNVNHAIQMWIDLPGQNTNG